MISATRAESFRRQGYAVDWEILADAELALAEGAIAGWAERLVGEWTGRGLRSSDYKTEFLTAWKSAGSPQFKRSPYANLVTPEFFEFLRLPKLISLAGELLATDEVSVHGIFNFRPMMPGAHFTPWHQDAQYWRAHGEPDPSLAKRRTVVTVWMPLQDLDERLGGLEVASLASTEGRLFADDLTDRDTNYLTVTPDVIASLDAYFPRIKRGGCLCFSQLTMHRGTPNNADCIRWSIDVRYESSDDALLSGRKYGFVASSPSGRHAVDTFESWRARCLQSLGPRA